MKVFVSYASEDRATAASVYQLLRDVGLKPWMDKFDLVGGVDWEREISRAVASSDLFLVLLSANSVSKRGVFQKEIKLALDEFSKRLEDDVFLIPLRLDSDVSVPDSLRRFQWINHGEPDWRIRLLKAIELAARKLGKPVDVYPFISTEVMVDAIEINDLFRFKGRKLLISEGHYPAVRSGLNPSSMKEINGLVESQIRQLIVENRTQALDLLNLPPVEDLGDFGAENAVWVNFEPFKIDKDIYSIAFSYSFYYSGAAHPNHAWIPQNFLVDPVAVLRFEDIFDLGGKPEIVDIIVASVYEYLASQEGDYREPGPTVEGFKQGLLSLPEFERPGGLDFAIEDRGITFLFAPYEIAPYAMGMLRGTLAWEVVARFANEHSVVWDILRSKFLR